MLVSPKLFNIPENPKTRAVLAFSGDPITYGHVDLIRRALCVFEHITVAIGINASKRYTFSLTEREAIAREVLKPFGDRVDVTSFEGLLVNFAHENSVTHIIRGLRTSGDFEFEKLLSDINKTQNMGIDTWFIPADAELGCVSSSAVKELVKNQGDVTGYVPLLVKEKLERVLLSQVVIGITGEIGAGKSYVAAKFVEWAKNQSQFNYHSESTIKNCPVGTGYPIHNIDLDRIGHAILEKETKPLYRETRENLIKHFGKEIVKEESEDNFINTKALGNIIFNDPMKLKLFNEITSDVILFKMKQDMIGKYGIILINSALLFEAQLTNLVNNNVIIVRADKQIRDKRLYERGYSYKEIEKRNKAQGTIDQKLRVYEEIKNKNKGYGNLWSITNNDINNIELYHYFTNIFQDILL
jgi:pantetheine-phosphate adenylyltransferase